MNVFSRVLVPVTVRYWQETLRGMESRDKRFFIEVPCNPFLMFFGLLRFDKNKSNFKPKLIMVKNKEDFNKECKKYEKLEKLYENGWLV